MSSTKQSQSQSQAQTPRPQDNGTISPTLADDILNGFNVDSSSDSDWEFLTSLLTSGLAPPVEVRTIWEQSLMRGMEEWEMMVDRANSLRDQAYQALRLKRGLESSASESVGDCELCLLPFLDVVMKGRVRSVLGGSGGVGGEEITPAKMETCGRKGVRKATAVVGRGISQFWAEDDTAKTNRRRTKVQLEASVLGYAGKAVKRDEPNQEEVNMASSTQLVMVVHRPAEACQDERGLKEKNPGLNEDASFGHSGLPDDTGNPDARSTRCNLALPSSPNEILDAAFGDVLVTDTLSFDESLPPATARITGKRTYKSPFFSETSPWPKSTNKTSPSKSKSSPSKTKTPTQKSQSPPPGISCLPIPPLSAPSFGLIQEEVASDPFRLLIAVTFLIKVRGTMAIPLFRQLMARFPTPVALAGADPVEIINIIRPLGLSVTRCSVIQKYARMWIECPPCKEKRYGVKNYPRVGDARGVKVGEEFGCEPEDFFYNGQVSQGGIEDGDDSTTNAVKLAQRNAIGSAWEIGHLTQGPYALDSWRIFCRDKLLGRAEDWKGKGRHPEFQPEWMRVLPRDKELKACLRWMWMREGWEWDPVTGEREPLREEMRRAVDEGRVGYDECGGLVIFG
ncbi:methylated-DNA-binding protein 3 [Pseudoneurospora amorphoporcata]|uniref:Methylated-DNA-binding protein 3 n=1 Tax=Pseudoneurospora amorphoporcata TaxID=241081 RepID=A0AAN6NY59_9PEZI|nr:methylated-DNA-binding protein 3 [Pseudoneurospora amorphoporcata]